MRPTLITVEDLFGLFSHTIPLNQEQRATIIHGPNGVGKTTLLRLTFDLLSRRLEGFRTTTFTHFSVQFDDGSEVAVVRPDGVQDIGAELFLQLSRPGRKAKRFNVSAQRDSAEKRRFPLSILERQLPVQRIGPQTWRDYFTDELLTLGEIAERYVDVLPELEELLSFPPDVTKFLMDINVHFIQTQRLLTPGRRRRGSTETEPEPAQPTALRYAHDLIRTVREELAQYAQLSQELDRTFPSRLLDQALPDDATEDVIRDRYNVQGDFRTRLIEAGLLESGDEVALPDRRLDDTERRVLWSYLDDVEKKLRVFSALLNKVELLIDIINSRFLYKKLHVDQEMGFRFHTDSGTSVTAAALSSGEQHELVLTYQLLFLVAPGSFVLIDEPEISLHVSWQQRFLSDISRISEIADLDFLIATHSPQIIHDRWDLAVPLAGDA
jgi:energy-coupling factor transporter ATP-binding protein EcfA2